MTRTDIEVELHSLPPGASKEVNPTWLSLSQSFFRILRDLFLIDGLQ